MKLGVHSHLNESTPSRQAPPLAHGLDAQSSTSISQAAPAYPGAQRHSWPLTLSLQEV